ncbi:Uncharacterized protein GBIM_09548 [Gryllus bimaculatus]|nr:Uncharacterized protein GBIM_09548 [Gryllus bimaculatus]
MLDCGGDTTWMLTMLPAASPRHARSRKWRPFGSRRRRQQGRRGMKRNIPSTPPARLHHYRPRTRPTDSDTIQRMIANLPPKRSTRRVIQFNEDESKTRNQANIHNISVAAGLSRLAQQRSRAAAAERQASLSLPSSPGTSRKERAQAILARKRATPPSSPAQNQLPNRSAGLSSSAPGTPLMRPARPSSVPIPIAAATRNLKLELDLEDVALSERVSIFRLKLSSGLKALRRAKARAVRARVNASTVSVDVISENKTTLEVEELSTAVPRGRTTRRSTGAVRSSSQSTKITISEDVVRRSVSLDNKKTEKPRADVNSLDDSETAKSDTVKVAKMTRSKKSKESVNVSIDPSPNQTSAQETYALEQDLQDSILDDDLSNSVNKETSNILAAMRIAMMESEKSILNTQTTVEEKEDVINQVSRKRTRSKTFAEVEDKSKKPGKKVKTTPPPSSLPLPPSLPPPPPPPPPPSLSPTPTSSPPLKISEEQDNKEVVRDSISCETCGATFVSLSTLGRHKKKCSINRSEPDQSTETTVDASNTAERQLCQHCGKYFPYSPMFWKHLKTCPNSMSELVKDTDDTGAEKTKITSKILSKRTPKSSVSTSPQIVISKEAVDENVASPGGSDDDRMPELEKVEPIEVVKRITRSRKEDLADIPILSPVISDVDPSVQEPSESDTVSLPLLSEAETLLPPPLSETIDDDRKGRRRQRKARDSCIEKDPAPFVSNIKDEPEVESSEGDQVVEKVLGRTRKSWRQNETPATMSELEGANVKPSSPTRKHRSRSRTGKEEDNSLVTKVEEQVSEVNSIEETEDALKGLPFDNTETNETGDFLETSSKSSVYKRPERRTKQRVLIKEEDTSHNDLNESSLPETLEPALPVENKEQMIPLASNAVNKNKKRNKKKKKKDFNPFDTNVDLSSCPDSVMAVLHVDQVKEEFTQDERQLAVSVKHSEVPASEDPSSNLGIHSDSVESIEIVKPIVNSVSSSVVKSVEVSNIHTTDFIVTEETKNSISPNIASGTILSETAATAVEDLPNKRRRNQTPKVQEDATLPPEKEFSSSPRKSHRSMRRLSLTSLPSDSDSSPHKRRRFHSNNKHARRSSLRIKISDKDSSSKSPSEPQTEISPSSADLVDGSIRECNMASTIQDSTEIMNLEGNENALENVLQSALDAKEDCNVQVEEPTNEDYFAMDEESLPIAKLRDPDFMVLYHSRKMESKKVETTAGPASQKNTEECETMEAEISKVEAVLESSNLINTESSTLEEEKTIQESNPIADVIEETSIPQQTLSPKRHDESSTPMARRERSVRITRWNLSYEEMYTSSDVASETDSQEFDTSIGKELADVPDQVLDKPMKQSHKKNGHLPVRKGKKAQIRRKSIKIQMAKNKRHTNKRRKTVQKKSPSDVKENAKLQTEVAPHINVSTDKIEGCVPTGVLTEQHQTALSNSVGNDTVAVADSAEVFKEDLVTNVKKRKRRRSTVGDNVIIEVTTGNSNVKPDIIDNTITIDMKANVENQENTGTDAGSQEMETFSSGPCPEILSEQEIDELENKTPQTSETENTLNPDIGEQSTSEVIDSSRRKERLSSSDSQMLKSVQLRYHCSICNKYYSTSYNLRKHATSTYHLVKLNELKESGELVETVEEYNLKSITEWTTVNKEVSCESVLKVEHTLDTSNAGIRKKPKIKRKQLEEAIKILQESSSGSEHNNNGLGMEVVTMTGYLKENTSYEPNRLSDLPLKNETSEGNSSGSRNEISSSVGDKILGPSSWSQNSCTVYAEQSTASSSFSVSGNYEKHLLSGELEFSASTSPDQAKERYVSTKQNWTPVEGVQESAPLNSSHNNSSSLPDGDVAWTTQKSLTRVPTVVPGVTLEEGSVASTIVTEPVPATSSVLAPIPATDSGAPPWGDATAAWPAEPQPGGEVWSSEEGSWHWPQNVPDLIPSETSQSWGQEGSFFSQLEGGASLGSIMDSVNQILDSRVDGEAALAPLPAPAAFLCGAGGILQTLMARRSRWGGRESPECRAVQDQSLLFEYQDKEMVCPLCHRFFLGLMSLQAHIASNHKQEQVGQTARQPRPRKSLASLLSSAPRASIGAPRLLCSHCRELLPDETSLARHVKEAHSPTSAGHPSIASEGTSTPDKPTSADPGAAGLRIQMSNALGSLFDRALSNVLGKGKRPGVAPDSASLEGAPNVASGPGHGSGREARRGSLVGDADDPDGKESGAEPDRPFACPSCDDRFFTLSSRNRHIARVHARWLGPQPQAQAQAQAAAGGPGARPARPRPRTGSSPDNQSDDDPDDVEGWRDSPTDWSMDPIECEDGAGSFLCSDCGINFESPQDVLRHRRLEHSSQDVTSNISIDQEAPGSPKPSAECVTDEHGGSSVSEAHTSQEIVTGVISHLSNLVSKATSDDSARRPDKTYRKDNDHAEASGPVEADGNIVSLTQIQVSRESTIVADSPLSSISDMSIVKTKVAISKTPSNSFHVDSQPKKKQVKLDLPKKKERLSRKALHSGDMDDEADIEIRARAEAALRELNRHKARGSSGSGSKWGLTFTVTESPNKQGGDSEGSLERKNIANASNRFNLPLVRKLPLGEGRYASLVEKKKKHSSVSADSKKTPPGDSPETVSDPNYLEKSSLDIYEFEEEEVSPSVDFGLRTSQTSVEEKAKSKEAPEVQPFFPVNGEVESEGGLEEVVAESKALKSGLISKDIPKKAFEMEPSCSTENSMSALSSEDSSSLPVASKDNDLLESSTSVSDMDSTSENSKESFNLSVKQKMKSKSKNGEYSQANSVVTGNRELWRTSRRKCVQESQSEETSDDICDESDDSMVQKTDEISGDLSSDSCNSPKLNLPTRESQPHKRHKSESETKVHRVSKNDNLSDRSSVPASRRRRAKSDLLISIFAKSKRNFMTNSIISNSKSFVNIEPPSEDISSDDSEQSGVVEKNVVSSQVL